MSTYCCPNCNEDLGILVPLAALEAWIMAQGDLPDMVAMLCPHCAALLALELHTQTLTPLGLDEFPDEEPRAFLKDAQARLIAAMQAGTTKQ